MATYFAIGIIVSLVELFMMHVRLKKQGLTFEEKHPEWKSLSTIGYTVAVIVSISLFVVFWPLLVCEWIMDICKLCKVR